MMTVLERVVAAAANAVGADPQDLRGSSLGTSAVTTPIERST
jgi:hypothetical protein